MRRQLLLTVAVSTMVVLVVFFVPLAWLIRTAAADRATSAATVGAQPLAAVLGVGTRSSLSLVVDQVRAALGDPVTVYLGDGAVIGDARPRTSAVDLAATGRAFTASLPDGGREVLIPVEGRPEGTAVIRVEVPAATLHHGVAGAWLLLGTLGIGLLLLALLVADQLARSYLRPLRSLTETASRLGAGDLSARARPGGPPEVADAGRAVNRLGSRIETLLHAEREAVADLSHRLRTPISALRLDAEDLSNEEERTRLSRDVSALSVVVDDVIDQARRPAREATGAWCDAVSVVKARTAFWRVLARETQRRLDVHTPSCEIAARISAQDLGHALDALLGNVFQHTPDGVGITVSVLPGPNGGALVVVDDEGPGLPGPEVVTRGTSAAGSTGLGLDIVRRAAEGSGGCLTLTPRVPSPGLHAVMELGAPA